MAREFLEQVNDLIVHDIGVWADRRNLEAAREDAPWSF
jgi:hypothetical protein